VSELTATFKPVGDNVELYAGFTVERTEISFSKEVNARLTRRFVTGAVPSDTTDVELVFKIPVGMIIKLQ
jgi:hypothetical protein